MGKGDNENRFPTPPVTAKIFVDPLVSVYILWVLKEGLFID